jgi:hypothetical protein
MADALTNNLALIQPQQGGDSGTWGTILNNGVIGALDNILGSNFSTSITSVDVTLTTTQFQNAIFIVNGALTGDHSLILPFSTNSTTVAVGGKFIVINNTSNAHKLSVKTAAANATSGVVTVPQGQACALYSDTLNVGYDNTGLPASVPAVSGSPNTQLAGTAGAANVNASLAADFNAGQLYLCTTTGTASTAQWVNVAGQPGFNTAQNLALSATVGSNILTVSLLAANTVASPTVGNPVTVIFQNGTGAIGTPTTSNITSALSISTIVGATLGSQNGTPFRFWVVLYSNGGTPALGLINCSTLSGGITSLDEAGSAVTPTQMSAGATSAGVFYCANGTSVASSVIRILGYLTYETGLVTAGTYNNAPTFVRLFGPGVKKPGDALQNITATISTPTTVGQSNTQTAVTASITPSSRANLIVARGIVYVQQGSTNAILQWSRGTSPTLVGSPTTSGGGGVSSSGIVSSAPVVAYDQPGVVSAQSYYIFAKCSSGTIIVGSGTVFSTTVNSTVELIELMC